MLLLSEGPADEAEESVALERSSLIMFRYKLAFAFGGTWSCSIFITSHKIAYKTGIVSFASSKILQFCDTSRIFS